MKNPYLSNNVLFTIIFIAVAGLFVINSCKKDVKQSDRSPAKVSTANKVNIQMLKDAYNKDIAGDKLKLNDVSQQTIANIN